MKNRFIDLDRNATTPLRKEVRERMIEIMTLVHGNPSSLHRAGREARRVVEDAREQVARLVQVEVRDVFFTSGATEANAAVLRDLAARARHRRLAITAIEHPSIMEPAETLARFDLRRLEVDAEGVLQLDSLDRALSDGCDLVAVMAANNEVGSLQPLLEVAERCAESGVPLHVDAVQLPGKLSCDLSWLKQGSAAISAHKFGGPKGVGALILRGRERPEPLVRGGGQERGWRAGTENVVGIAGLGRAASLLIDEGPATADLQRAEAHFLAALDARGVTYVRHGPHRSDMRLPGTLSLRIPGALGESTMLQLDLAGIGVSLGSACSSGAMRPSHVLAAMGLSKTASLESIRVSLGADLEAAELELAADAFAQMKP